MLSPASTYSTENALPSRTPAYTAEFAGISEIYSTHHLFDYETLVLALNPTLYLRFGETSGTDAIDSSGNALDGVYQNTPTLGAAGLLSGDSNKAVTLDGSTEYVTVADDDLLDLGTDTLTLSIWCQAADYSSAPTLIDKGTNGYRLGVDGGGNVYLSKVGVGTIVTSTVALAVDVPQYLVATKSGGTVKLYLNGVDVTGTVTDQTIAPTATNLHIGVAFTGTGYFPGTVDETALFAVALAAHMVRELYETGIALYRMTGVTPCMELPSGIAAQIEPEQGRSTVGMTVLRLSDLADYDHEVLADAPSFFAKLDEVEGTVAADSSGNGLNGVYQNSPTLGVKGGIAGKPNRAVTFNGTNQYVSVADNDLLDPGDTLTLELLVKVDAYPGTTRWLIDKQTDSYALDIGATGALRFQKQNVGNIFVTGAAAVPLATWTHILITKSGATATKLYINGADVTPAITDRTIAANASALLIGASTGIANFFPGSIARVALYSTALSAERAFQHHQAFASAVGTNGAITRIVTQNLGGKQVTLKAGFNNICFNDFVTYMTGIVDKVAMFPNMTGYEITGRDPSALTNRQVFSLAASPLAAALTDVATTAIVKDTTDFLSAGYVRVEDELIQYTGKTSGIQLSQDAWLGLAYGNGVWVAVGTNVVATSTDGINWTPRTPAENNGWQDVVYGGGQFVAVSSNGTNRVMTSPDGITWTARSAAAASAWEAIAYSSSLGMFAAVAPSAIMTSTDGIAWTSRTSPGTSVSWNDVAWSPDLGMFAAVADADGTGTENRICTSTDGVTWTGRSTPTQENFLCIAWGIAAGVFAVITGLGTRATTSPDGITWTNRTCAHVSNSVTWSESVGLFVGVGNTGAVQTSSDGITWTSRTAAAAVNWQSVRFGNALYVAVASNGNGTRQQRSSDGINWSTSFSSLTGLTRGVDIAGVTTAGAAHSAGVPVAEVLRLGPDHPLDIFLDVLDNTDKTGLSIPAALIDTATIATVKTAIGSSYEMEFLIEEAVNAKQWLEEEICRPLGIYMVTKGDGTISIVRIAAAGSAVDTLTHDDMADTEAGSFIEFGQDFNTVINVVKFEYDFNPFTGVFGATKETTDSTSITRFGRKEHLVQSRGLRSSLAGTTDLITARSQATVDRYKDGLPVVPIRLLLSNHLLEPGDIVAITSALLPNPSTKGRGVTAAKMETVGRSMLFNQGEVQLQCHWTDYNV